MTNLFSNDDKDFVGGLFDSLHESMSREITLFYNNNGGNISESSEYDSDGNWATVENQDISTETITARVNYLKEQTDAGIGAKSHSNLPVSNGKVRLKIHKDDYSKIKLAEKILIDDFFFEVDGDPDVMGIFGYEYYSIMLKRIN